MSFKVLFDANVLIPARLNDIILNFAAAEIYTPLWSEDILREVERTMVNRLEVDASKAQSRLAKMDRSFPDAKVENYRELIERIECTDLKDRHVLAAAITGGAGALVTFNLKDFPSELFELHGINLEHPDDFLASQFDLNASLCSSRMALLLRRWNRPSLSISELIRAYGSLLPEFCGELDRNSGAIEFHRSLMG
jgi:predicted nucleic acid-binding protein